MKLDWSTAPEWARFAAMDKDGSWWWFEVEPYFNGYGWRSRTSGRYALAAPSIGAADTLEARPEGA